MKRKSNTPNLLIELSRIMALILSIIFFFQADDVIAQAGTYNTSAYSAEYKNGDEAVLRFWLTEVKFNANRTGRLKIKKFTGGYSANDGGVYYASSRGEYCIDTEQREELYAFDFGDHSETIPCLIQTGACLYLSRGTFAKHKLFFNFGCYNANSGQELYRAAATFRSRLTRRTVR